MIALRVKRKRPARLIALMVAVAVLLVLLGLRACAPDADTGVTVVAVGDMACDPRDPGLTDDPRLETCRELDVSNLALKAAPAAFLGLGDYQYEIPSAESYEKIYGPSWGRLRDITIPALGNQEYKVHDANTFYEYFGERAGPVSGQGYWATQVGAWQVLVLNSNCIALLGGCAKGSPQQLWLEQTLSTTHYRCRVALWHHPRWSVGIGGPDDSLGALYQTLFDHQVTLLLTGHEADYERFPALDPKGRKFRTGVVQFVVGTGGQAVYDPLPEDSVWPDAPDLIAPKPLFTNFTESGFLRLELNPTSYSWEFVGITSGVLDQGTSQCN
ncbi:MAG: metallophosphoesterase family protein [Candidatus Nanopelagicales bacterium]